MNEEINRESGPRPTEFRIVDKDGVSLTIDFGYDMSVFLERVDKDGGKTLILADFPSVINGGGRHPQTMRALEWFRSPKVPEVHREDLPITVSTQDDSSRNQLIVSITSEENIHVTIKGISGRGTPNQVVTFTLGHQDEGFNEELLSRFANLAKAIQEDEIKIRSRKHFYL